jgi:hypothetical protein
MAGATGGPRTQALARGVRRAWPLVLAAYERWQALPEHEKERYKRRAREYAQRGRRVVEEQRKRFRR